jgi:outer membrane protein assembly factor BamB
VSGPHRLYRVLGTGLVTLMLAACGGSPSADWPSADHDPASTRANPRSGITRANVGTLQLLWRRRIHTGTDSGSITSTPVIADGSVFIQDMKSNVMRLDARSGRLIWRHVFGDTSPGPNGIAAGNGRIYGATDTTVFALASPNGRLLWSHRVITQSARFIDIAPQVLGNAVYVSTIGLPPNGRGTLYALDASVGKVLWKRSTIRGRFSVPEEAGGGGAWYPPSVDASGVYWGTANPYPYGGSKAHPNGGAYAGRALYTDSLVVTDETTGRIRWYDQITPHDVRDFDFEAPPILAGARVLGAGKAGRVIAWDKRSHRRVWTRDVGVHKNDEGPLPATPTLVCPGLYGGVETPMAYAEGVLFVPVVNLCAYGSSHGYKPLEALDPRTGTGELVAIDARRGHLRWKRSFALPDFGCATVARGVVFTSTFDGSVYALDTRDGARLWTTRAAAGINSCPALGRRLLVLGAGVGRNSELEAYAPSR